MKEQIHPTYHQGKFICGGCGTVHTIGSTLEESHVSVCSECHPFYTGKAKVLDSEGRVERFKKKYAGFKKD